MTAQNPKMDFASLNPFFVNSTGVRVGEKLIGNGQANGLIIEIDSEYPPSTAYRIDWTKEFKTLSRLPGFQNFTLDEIITYFTENEITDEDLYLSDDPNRKIRFIQIPPPTKSKTGNNIHALLSAEQLAILATGEWISFQNLNEWFRKPGSRARRPTLLFRPWLWSVELAPEIITEFEGIVIDSRTGDVNYKLTKLNPATEFFTFITPEVAVIAPINENKEFLSNFLTETRIDDRHINFATAGVLKSLLQKCIRFGCLESRVSFSEETVQTTNLARYSFLKLLQIHSSFVPNLRTHSRGVESACKRMAVSIVEDGYVENFSTIVSLLASALVARNNNKWYPDEHTVQGWLIQLDKVVLDRRCYVRRTFISQNAVFVEENASDAEEVDSDFPESQGFTVDVDSLTLALKAKKKLRVPHQVSFFLMGLLGSFSMDLVLFENLANPKLPIRKGSAFSQEKTGVRVLEFSKALDHHCASELAYFFDFEDLAELGNTETNNFTRLFSAVWNHSSGYNSRRRGELLDREKSEMVWRAQDRLWRSKNSRREVDIELSLEGEVVTSPARASSTHSKSETRVSPVQPLPLLPNSIYQFTYELPNGILSGMMGVYRTYFQGDTILIIHHASDPEELQCIRRPSREDKGGIERNALSDETKHTVLENYRDLLRTTGRELSGVPDHLPQFKGCWLFLRETEESEVKEEEFFIRFPSSETELSWQTARNLIFEFPEFPFMTSEQNSLDVLLRLPRKEKVACQKVARQADTIFDQVLTQLPLATLRRFILNTANFPKHIFLPAILRSGEAQDYELSVFDVQVNEFLATIALIFPAALEISAEKGWNVKCGPLMWNLVERAKLEMIRKTEEESDGSPSTFKLGWPEPTLRPLWLPSGARSGLRPLWLHQTSTVQELLHRHYDLNQRNHIMWLPVGMGKTMIVIAYFVELIKRDNAPPYLIYTLPSSAMLTIAKEWGELSGFQVKELDATLTRGSKLDQKIEPFVINLISHHHLILNRTGLKDEIARCAPDAFFVIDEFHELLNPTKRTSTALDIVLSARESLALSGTIIKDEKHEPLIKWLASSSNFPITTNNFWVAVGSVISRQVPSQITIDRQTIELEYVRSLLAYRQVVTPQFGGTAVQVNFQRAVEICNAEIDKAVIKEVLSQLEHGERGVFVFARNIKHALKLAQEMIENERILSRASPKIPREAERISPKIPRKAERILPKIPLKPARILPKIHIVTSSHSIKLSSDFIVSQGPIDLKGDSTDDDPHNINVVITTPSHVASYNLTKFRVRVSGVIFSNQAKREQLDGRLARAGQVSPTVLFITFTAGILTNIWERYERARNLSDALKGFGVSMEVGEANEVSRGGEAERKARRFLET